MNPETVLSLAEAAEYLKLEPRKIRSLCRLRKIAHTREGNTLTFDLAALIAYRESIKVPAIAPNPHGLTDASVRRIRRAS